MGADANTTDDPADLAALARYAAALCDAVDEALPGWVERSVLQRWVEWHGDEPPPTVTDGARSAGRRARAEVIPELRALLGADVDAQRSNPLAVIRRATAYPTEVLAAAGVPAVERDQDSARRFPHDPYDLTPAAFADLGAAVHEPGLEWGAAKAHVILRRRRSAG